MKYTYDRILEILGSEFDITDGACRYRKYVNEVDEDGNLHKQDIDLFCDGVLETWIKPDNEMHGDTEHQLLHNFALYLDTLTQSEPKAEPVEEQPSVYPQAFADALEKRIVTLEQHNESLRKQGEKIALDLAFTQGQSDMLQRIVFGNVFTVRKDSSNYEEIKPIDNGTETN